MAVHKRFFFSCLSQCAACAVLHLFVLSASVFSASAFEPLEYPFGTIGNPRPPFVWQDLYNERDLRYKAKYKITIKKTESKSEENAKTEFFFSVPARYQASFFIAPLPFGLAPGSYTYRIERFVDGASVDSRYYYYRRYPIAGEFTLHPEKLRDFEKLSNEKMVDYLLLERKNKRENGYHALFFTSSGTIALGAGFVVYRYTNFGIISTAIAAVCALSSAVGYGAGAYYGYRYFEGKRELEKMITKHDIEQMKQSLTEKTAWFSISRSL
jgi:hypothetical protein